MIDICNIIEKNLLHDDKYFGVVNIFSPKCAIDDNTLQYLKTKTYIDLTVTFPIPEMSNHLTECVKTVFNHNKISTFIFQFVVGIKNSADKSLHTQWYLCTPQILYSKVPIFVFYKDYVEYYIYRI